MRQKPDKIVLPFRLRPGELMKTIRSLAKASENVFFGSHARQRMEQRGISDADAIRVLVLGEIKGNVTPGDKAGEWKCKVVARVKGSRETGVVTVTLDLKKILVVTVEWEDP